MTTDRYANSISPCSPEVEQAIDDFVHGFLAYQPKAANILAGAEAAPENALANAYAGMLWMFLEAPVAAEKAAPYIARARAAETANARERSITQIAATWVSGDVPETMRLSEAHVDQYPSDLTIIKLAQYLYFNFGDAPSMLRVGLKALPSEDPYVHGMIAFGYEQCHQLELAETSARRAIEIEPTDAWAHHAIVHENNRKDLINGLAISVILGVAFTALQAYEYAELILHHDWVFGGDAFFSAFFMATGFHGFHVVIGTIFLFVCLIRAMRGDFTPEQHVGFEAAAWYWHFVDVVWLFLFFAVYIWGVPA